MTRAKTRNGGSGSLCWTKSGRRAETIEACEELPTKGASDG